jgi:hypothetical protein
MPGDLKSDIRELHSKTNSISERLAALSGELSGTLKHLATKTDISEMKTEVGEIVSESIDKQAEKCSRTFQPRANSRAPAALAPSSPNPGPNNKIVIALTAGITAAISALTAVIYKLIQGL